MAALATGAGAGSSELASDAVGDAYSALRDGLRRRLHGRARAERALEASEAEPGAWQARIEDDIIETGADHDDDIVAAARRLLALTDPAGTHAGKYMVDARAAGLVQAGDGVVHVDINYGASAGTISGPVTVNYGEQLPLPPLVPVAS